MGIASMPLTRPKIWMTAYNIVDRTLVIRFAHARRLVSSAVYGGGIVRASAIINHQVDLDLLDGDALPCKPNSFPDPRRYLGQIAQTLGVPSPCVGLMTAVDMRWLVVKREEAEGVWVEGFFTVGVTNAVHAGEPIRKRPRPADSFQTGTINIILITNARLSSAALIGAVGVATESKTAVLFERHILNDSGSDIATGTGTDALVIATGDGPRLRYSGTHTKIGELIGRVVARGVNEGLTPIVGLAMSGEMQKR
ncbi:MAG: hypothetical protein GKS05_11555 [Nitrospirales bacterium]|nr:hypothetical protein [Nitrospirales bacterium]